MAVGGFAAGHNLARMEQLAFAQQATREQALALEQQNAASDTRYKDFLIRKGEADIEAGREQARAERERMRMLASAMEDEQNASLETVEERLIQQANALSKLGDAKGAGEILAKASQVRRDREAANSSSVLSRKRELEMEMKVLDDIKTTFVGVKTPEQHAQALMAIQSMPWAADFPIPEELKTFDPELIKAMVANTDAEKNRRELELREADQKLKAWEAGSRDRYREFMKNYRNQVLADRQKRTEHTLKAGGNPKETEPPKNLIDRAKAEVTRLVGRMEPGHADVLADDIAREALRRSKINPALTREEAVTQVLAEMQVRGDIQPKDEGFLGLGIAGTKKPRYEAKPGTVNRPAPMPSDLKTLKPDTVYLDPVDGKRYHYTQDKQWKAVEPATPPRNLGPMNPLLEDEEDEE